MMRGFWEQLETERQNRQTDSQTNVKLNVRRSIKEPGFFMHTDIFSEMS